MYQKRNNRLNILALYLQDYKKQLYLREISRTAKIPLKTTQNLLQELEKEKILKSTVSGKNKYFKLNLDNIHAKLELLNAEVYRTSLFLEGYPSFKTFLKDINTNELFVVFGSFAKFKADKNSDLDILIVSNKKADLPLHLLAYKIHKLELSTSNLIISLKNQETLIKEVQENHIILNNHSLYINLLWSYHGRK